MSGFLIMLSWKQNISHSEFSDQNSQRTKFAEFPNWVIIMGVKMFCDLKSCSPLAERLVEMI